MSAIEVHTIGLVVQRHDGHVFGGQGFRLPDIKIELGQLGRRPLVPQIKRLQRAGAEAENQ